MSNSSGRGSSDSVHQANLATFQSFRKTIEELTHHPRTVLGDHASLVRRIQEWRRTVSHLTIWVTDDRAYYQQARPEIVNLLEAVFDSVRAVDTVRSQIAGPDWVRASEKEFESLLQDYIKLIEIAFPPHRQSRYNTPGDQEHLNRGKILYNGLYSFKRRLEEVRGNQAEQRRASAPQLQQNPVPQQQPIVSSVPPNAFVPPHLAPQNHVGSVAFQNGAPAPNMRPYTQPVNIARTHSLPAGTMVPMRPVMAPSHTMPHLVNGTQPPPQNQVQSAVQNAPIKQSPSSPPPPPVPSNAKPAADNAPSSAMDAVPSEEQDWDLDWAELEALDRSEWEDNNPKPAEDRNISLDPAPIAVETAEKQPLEAPSESHSVGAPLVEPSAINKPGTLTESAVGEPSERALSTRPKTTTPDVSESKPEDPTAQPTSPGHEHIPTLVHPESLAEDVIDIDELPGDEALASSNPPPTQKESSSELVSPTLDEGVINIQYSDDEMEVDELDPSEPPGSVRPSVQPDEPTVPSSQAEPSKTEPPRSSKTSQAVPAPNQQSTKSLNSLPPDVRAEIRQRAKEPLIAHYLSITSSTREVAEVRFQEMSDQEVFDLYEKMEHPRRIVDHYKNTLVHASRKIHLPHIEVQEPSSEPPTLLCSVPGAVRLSSETVEFSISPEVMASLERWRDRFVTPAGSHGELITLELACYPKDAFHLPEGKGRRELTPNAQTRTWPDGGILWAFINSEDETKDRKVRLFLSPPPFVELKQPVDISDFIREGRNTVKFVHLGGMEHFTFAIQTRRMPPPHLTWPGVLKRIQSLDPSANGYAGLINRISVMLEEK